MLLTEGRKKECEQRVKLVYVHSPNAYSLLGYNNSIRILMNESIQYRIYYIPV